MTTKPDFQAQPAAADPSADPSADPAAKPMDDIMALCKRRGFLYGASEIYGGLNGFWDYGPLGAQLKKNLRDAWWRDTVECPPIGPTGDAVRIVGLDSSIVQHPRVWESSGHVGGFNDPMSDCRETKRRYRADHVIALVPKHDPGSHACFAFVEGDPETEPAARKKAFQHGSKRPECGGFNEVPLPSLAPSLLSHTVGPHASSKGTLTSPRAFNLMFKTYIGATATEDDAAYLRPETAQGIFINFKNVLDTARVEPPFGVAQTGKSFRNEVTPRNFTFRSREFEQMELEFFCAPEDAGVWYTFWRDTRIAWWRSLGLCSANLRLRSHGPDELAHYAKEGAGTADIEYRFPFTSPGFGELEGIADRSTYDLTQHAECSGAKLQYLDRTRGELAKNGVPKGQWRTPNVIEPSAGLDRGVLALLCEAYTPAPERPSKVYMHLHPRIAPIKAAVFPLVAKDGMPEVACKLHAELRARFGAVESDAKQSIGKRYARMDEAGCPLCFTVDGQSLQDQTVTVRNRDTLEQSRIGLDSVAAYVADRIAQPAD